ncbi:MAG TPA: hypothetical protein DCQ26_09230 [Marinilabiliales bacterium]|jgi:hypothetical protein|nr:MAG: hypothetical protein A2W95_05835 [Bacteroidetes bacterium GWA2_40_14]OFX59946.1 MAG: hypothetical protein A2W84_17390 [Bacteroidetes bacterium GWC2_40_13]OFX76263.1 MAG: hypothetical protein A2W96_03490 [Bacteroidetes bacterium GWD2_40_43]OFX95764.1 MAG: hypothetical protein A2W97_15840 [Bacteroidetes bacterium GWE2_40_63]OFY21727.1 MAG: hypothetical protein A2W88_05795 [Bacteroidetes bacterium GWF2_40_13]OFZ23911.1 MAG: hypothetical protein A2437_10235 [Bacteroidetes bacterium RIFOXYC
MEKSLAIKIASIIFYILFGISILLGVLFYINDNESPMLVYTYILTGIAMASTLIFTVVSMFQSKKSLISSLTVIGLFGALVLISYLMSSDAMPTFFGVETFKLTGGTLKLIDTSLFMMYILIAVSFVGLLYTEIRGAFK